MSGSPEGRSAAAWAVALCLGIVYIVWGSTYAAILIALGGFPPFLLGGIRFLTAGTLLFLFALAARHPLPSRTQLRDAALIGLLLLCVGNGGVVWAEQHVATGLAAVIIATVPLWMIGIDAVHPRGEPLTAKVFASFVLGLAGVAVLMAGGVALGRGSGFWLGVAALLGASFAWALGSIYARHAAKPTSYAVYTALEMLAGGAALTLLATARGEWARLDSARILGPPLWGELYLVFFGSILAFSAYVWLLRAAPPTLVGTYAYVNPVVAILLGIVLFGESLDGWMLAGSAVILMSVVLSQLVRVRRVERASAPAPECVLPKERVGAVLAALLVAGLAASSAHAQTVFPQARSEPSVSMLTIAWRGSVGLVPTSTSDSDRSSASSLPSSVAGAAPRLARRWNVLPGESREELESLRPGTLRRADNAVSALRPSPAAGPDHALREPAEPVLTAPQAGTMAAAVGLALAFDDDLRDFYAEEAEIDELAGATRVGKLFGDGRYTLPPLAAGYLAGRLLGEPSLSAASSHATGAFFIAGAISEIARNSIGRSRPRRTDGSDRFDPFDEDEAFPSGHVTVAWAVAAALAEHTPHRLADIGLYGLATLTTIERVRDDKHWTSDVVAGAVLGTVVGRWVARGRGGLPFEVTNRSLALSLRH